ncbi:MAG: hypothetical protein Tsb0034_12790 [Ekhidna sp.]
MKKWYLIFLLPIVSFGQQADVTIKQDITSIAFGSCNVQNYVKKQLWKEVSAQNPDLWIWLGDNVYSDGEDMNQRRADYDLQKSHPDYQKLLANTGVIGIWDDHDYGLNDGGKEYPKKDESKAELFRFLDVPKDHPAQNRKGAYQSYSYEGTGGTIKIILLDGRYFRDKLEWENYGTPDKKALVNETGDMLGEKQWQWLKTQLQDESADFIIVACGIQFIPTQHRFEKWANFPVARERFFEVLKEHVKVPLVLMSGDRHTSEISKIDLDGYPFPIFEFTSSSLNSSYPPKEDPNKFRVKHKVYEPNYALMNVSWEDNMPFISIRFYMKDNELLLEHSISYK